MNILQLTNKPPYPPRDGGAIAIYNLWKGLMYHGHKVEILSMSTPKHNPVSKNTPFEIHNIFVNTRVNLFHILYNLLFTNRPIIAERFISKTYAHRLRETLQSNSFDVVQLEGLYLTSYVPLIRKYSNALIAFRTHNIEHEIWVRIAQHEKTRYKKWYIKILASRLKNYELNALKQTDVLIPISKRDAEIFIQLGIDKPLHVSPTGIDLESLPAIYYKEEVISDLGYIGSLDWIPNQEGLIWFLKNVWQHLKIRNPDITFQVAGRNAPKWLVKKLLEESVIYAGEVTDAYSFMVSNRIMVVPLFAGSGMRIKIIEAMALSNLVVTTSIGAEGLKVNNGENIIIADKAAKFINEIQKLLKEKNRSLQIKKNAHQFIKDHYNNKKIAKDLADFYKKQAL